MTTTHKSESKSKSTARRAEILREYGPFPGMDQIHGVTFDGAQVWFARGESIVALNPKSGAVVRELPVAAEAGTAFRSAGAFYAGGRRRQGAECNSLGLRGGCVSASL